MFEWYLKMLSSLISLLISLVACIQLIEIQNEFHYFSTTILTLSTKTSINIDLHSFIGVNNKC